MANRAMIPQIVRQRAAAVVAGHLRTLIMTGELASGARIPQEEMAEALGISRMPLREALLILEQEGWITIETHRGAFVNVLDGEVVEDHYAIYGMLLGFGARLAIQRGDAKLGSELQALRARFVTASDPRVRGDLAVQFNRVVLDAGRSGRLRRTLRAMRGIPLGDFYEVLPDFVEVQAAAMSAIARAIESGDAAAASSAYEGLMEQAGVHVLRTLVERGVIAGAGGRPATSRC